MNKINIYSLVVMSGFISSFFVWQAVSAMTAPLPKPEQADNSLHSMSIKTILSCADGNCWETDWDLGQELAQRLKSSALLSRFHRALAPQRRILLFAMYSQLPNAAVSRLMRHLYHASDEVAAYYALNYGAKQCDRFSLRELSAPPFLVRADCLQWATTIELYGKCNDKSGVPLLLWSLDSACLNVSDAAEDSLRAMFTGAPKVFKSAEATKAYFKIRGHEKVF